MTMESARKPIIICLETEEIDENVIIDFSKIKFENFTKNWILDYFKYRFKFFVSFFPARKK